MLFLLKKLFGTQQTRLLTSYTKIIKKINEQESSFASLTNEELQKKTEEFRDQLKGKDRSIDDLLIPAYAVIKNACRRFYGENIKMLGYQQKWDMIPYDEQILGAIAMHYGAIAEMQTGEGKTITAAMPAYLHALTGHSVHVVTVNDYLAKRDSEWIGTIFRWLGLKVAVLTNDTPLEERRNIYQADIIYGTASEFGFDYLRDHSIATQKEHQCQRGHYMAIIDEADSVLIDESRLPLIISGPATTDYKQTYNCLKTPVYQMVKLQKEKCHSMAIAAKKILEKYNALEETKEPKKWTKQQTEKLQQALKNIWLISKGMPTHKIVKQVREHPDMRAKLDALETYYCSDQNKQERLEEYAKLYVIIDERTNEYELTDLGMQNWPGEDTNVFTMLDMGHEYALIEQNTQLSEEEKIQKKIELREYDLSKKEKSHAIRQLFRAHLLMEKDVDYIMSDDKKVVLISEHTGRPQPGQRYSDGLHQAIEAKENVSIQGETQPHATITLQNFFRLYKKKCGMTGTAITDAIEFKETYKLAVLQIPTHKSCQRKDFNDQIYMTEREKFHAILQEVRDIHRTGRPILIGAASVEESERISRLLTSNKIPHRILNAKQHKKEAEIISRAGEQGAITVSNNMTGRGTDIKLGNGVTKLGGLHVMGTSRNCTRRLDLQLRGRCGRQGDPGSTKFFLSLEDFTIRLFAPGYLTNIILKYRPQEGESISSPMLDRSIATAQGRMEQSKYSQKKFILQMDDVVNIHRQEVYDLRNAILHENNIMTLVMSLARKACYTLIQSISPTMQEDLSWLEMYIQKLSQFFPISFETIRTLDPFTSTEIIASKSITLIAQALQHKLSQNAETIAMLQALNHGSTVNPHHIIYMLQNVIQSLFIQIIDEKWQKYLSALEVIKTNVYMKAIGQKDPIIEFKQSSFYLFQSCSKKIMENLFHTLFSLDLFEKIPEEVKKTFYQKSFFKQARDPLFLQEINNLLFEK